MLRAGLYRFLLVPFTVLCTLMAVTAGIEDASGQSGRD
jgi:hypothetical protein